MKKMETSATGDIYKSLVGVKYSRKALKVVTVQSDNARHSRH